MQRRTAAFAFLVCLLAALAAAPAAFAAPRLDGTFSVPGLDGNSKIVQGPDGNMWATLPESNLTVARITPAGEVTSYNLNGVLGVEKPSGIATGPDGRLWITFNGGVASFSPADPEGSVQRTSIIEVAGFHSIVAGPDGAMWVATVNGLVRVPPANPTQTTPVFIPGLDPRDIDVSGPRLVVADLSEENEKGRIVTFTPGAAQPRQDFTISGGSQGVAGSPGGQIAYGVQKRQPNELGLINVPAAPLVTPSPGTDPFGVTLGPDGAYWFVQFLTASLSRLAADNKLTPGPTFPAGSQPKQIAAGPGRTLWVTLPTADAAESKVARIVGVDPEPILIVDPLPPPETTLRAGPRTFHTAGARARVAFRFSSPDGAASFECRLAKLAAAKRGPAFRSCKSPKTYRLTPGRYRFEVRATRAGSTDATPAKRSFRVVRAAKKRR